MIDPYFWKCLAALNLPYLPSSLFFSRTLSWLRHLITVKIIGKCKWGWPEYQIAELTLWVSSGNRSFSGVIIRGFFSGTKYRFCFLFYEILPIYWSWEGFQSRLLVINPTWKMISLPKSPGKTLALFYRQQFLDQTIRLFIFISIVDNFPWCIFKVNFAIFTALYRRLDNCKGWYITIYRILRI